MDELDKIRELIFSGVNHNIELGIIMAHVLNISLEDTLDELFRSVKLAGFEMAVFDIIVVIKMNVELRDKNQASGVLSYITRRRVSLRSPAKWTETFHDVTIDIAVKKLLIIFN
mgnify:CR=1 FL=1